MNNFIRDLLMYVLIPDLLPTTLCCISIIIFSKNTIKSKEIGKYFLSSYIINIIISTGSYVIILPVLSIICICMLKYDEDKHRMKELLVIFSACVVNIVTGMVIFIVLNEKENEFDIGFSKYKFYSFILSLVIVTLVWIISRVIGAKTKVESRKYLETLRLRMIVSICIPITIIILLIYTLAYLNVRKLEDFVLSSFIPQILPLISIILIILIIYNYDKAVETAAELKKETEEKNQIEKYSHVIEEMYSETRRFKHDYMNMLSPLKEYIDKDDINGLRDFFYNNVINMDRDIKWNNNNIDKLKYISITGLKAILSTKLIHAVSIGIDIKVEILEDINEVSMNIIDLCRIIGILLDNAIEASSECEYPKLSLCVVNKDEYLLIAIQNNFFGEKPVIHKIYKEGFSTKGSGRGLGLYTIKKIIDTKYNNAFLDTSVTDNIFNQELWIKKSNMSLT